MITNRTTADVNYAKQHMNSTEHLKGRYDESDMNRVESKVRELADGLKVAGYSNNITTKTNWTKTDIVTVSDWNRYVNNINELKRIFIYKDTTPTAIVNNNGMTIYDANDYEQIIEDIDKLYKGLTDSYRIMGATTMGAPLHSFRR